MAGERRLARFTNRLRGRPTASEPSPTTAGHGAQIAPSEDAAAAPCSDLRPRRSARFVTQYADTEESHAVDEELHDEDLRTDAEGASLQSGKKHRGDYSGINLNAETRNVTKKLKIEFLPVDQSRIIGGTQHSTCDSSSTGNVYPTDVVIPQHHNQLVGQGSAFDPLSSTQTSRRDATTISQEVEQQLLATLALERLRTSKVEEETID